LTETDQPGHQPPARASEADLSDDDLGTKTAAKTPVAMSSRFERRAILAAALLQLLILVAMILGKTVPYLDARRVLLKVIPVDPRDLFRGDYVTLAYDISRVPGARRQPGETVYVTLVPEGDGRHYRAGGFTDSPPSSGVFIRGTVGEFGRASYGIESYYLQEGTGHDYENAVRSGRLWADVALDGNGNARLKGLIIE
jgi:uncharacterized membrane-anchored protein